MLIRPAPGLFSPRLPHSLVSTAGAIKYARRPMRLLNNVGVAFLCRYACHSLMLGLAVWNEARPAPRLPDLIIDNVPLVPFVAQYNYHLWLLVYLPVALWLWRRDRAGFVHFLYAGGLLSLLRGLCIPLTGLGPVEGPDFNAGLDAGAGLHAWLDLINPLSTLSGGAAHMHLTKDLFFSGHTATTFLLWLYCRRHAGLGPVALAAHVFVVAVVFLSHLHYSVDVVGAWAITFGLFTILQRHWPSTRFERSAS